jgi:hypothetical protein
VLTTSKKNNDLKSIIHRDLEVLLRTQSHQHFVSVTYRKIGELQASLEAIQQTVDRGMASNEDYIALADVRSAMNDRRGLKEVLDQIAPRLTTVGEISRAALLYARHDFKKEGLALVKPLTAEGPRQTRNVWSAAWVAQVLTACDKKAEAAALLRTCDLDDLAKLPNNAELRVFHDVCFEAGALDLAYATAKEGLRRDIYEPHYQSRLALLRIIHRPDQITQEPMRVSNNSPFRAFRTLFRKLD